MTLNAIKINRKHAKTSVCVLGGIAGFPFKSELSCLQALLVFGSFSTQGQYEEGNGDSISKWDEGIPESRRSQELRQITWQSLEMGSLVFLQNFGLCLLSIQWVKWKKKPHNVFESPMSHFSKIKIHPSLSKTYQHTMFQNIFQDSPRT